MRQFLPLLVLFAAACGDDAAAPLPPAAFTLTVEHAERLDLTGDASFTADLGNSDIGTAFALRVQQDGGALVHSVALFRFVTDPLLPGDYPIVVGGDEDPTSGFRASLSLERDTPDPLACQADGGTLRVTSADAARVRATLDLVGSCWRESNPAALTRFTASGALHAEAGLPGPGELRAVRFRA